MCIRDRIGRRGRGHAGRGRAAGRVGAPPAGEARDRADRQDPTEEPPSRVHRQPPSIPALSADVGGFAPRYTLHRPFMKSAPSIVPLAAPLTFTLVPVPGT